MSLTDEQIAKLPVYAQKELHRLSVKVHSLTKELDTQQCALPTRVSWGMSDIIKDTAGGFLREDEYVTMRLTPRNKIRIHFNVPQKGIDIFGDHSLIIKSCSSNHIFVQEEAFDYDKT